MHLQNVGVIGKLLSTLVFIAIVVLIGHEFERYLSDMETWVGSLGVFVPLGFVFTFMILSPIFVSIDVLCFAAGLLFPIVTGELTAIIATYLSAAVIFFLGRNLIRERVLAFIAKHRRFATLDRIISGDNAFKLMLLLRLTPLPFAVISYALSVTHVKFWPYLVATSGILIYNGSLVYFGYTTKHLSGLIGRDSQINFSTYLLMIFGTLILLAILVYVAKIAHNTLKKMDIKSVE
jgi:uncharacterized membrane protein YdjX (TVP38/TMEM64 family)